MKRLLLLIMYVCCATVVMAQGQMKVKDFRLLESDQDARIAYKRQDDNNRLAALIKVQTTETGFNFSAGTIGIVGNVVYKSGEVWVYVPRRAQRLTITHPRYGVAREYEFPIPIEGGNVYELVLDLGVGRFMNISASEPHSIIIMDNDTLGPSPVTQRYILYGLHHFYASAPGYLEGKVEFEVTETSDENLLIPMQNVQNQYHRVTLNAGRGIQIFRDGTLLGSDSWEGILREGSYTFTTHRENYDDADTRITVGSTGRNFFDLTAPKPVNGTLKLTVSPLRTGVTNSQGQFVSHRDPITLPAGKHYFSFKASGYISQNDVEFNIQPHQITEHTINLEPIDYVKPTSFYAGGGYTYASLSGISVTAGVTLFNVDLQLSYAIGMSATDELSWYEEKNNSFYSKMNYKLNTFAVRLGYQVRLSNRLAVTPLLGYFAQSLSGNTIEGSGSLGDGASASGFTIGAKLVIIPAHHFGIFLMPEFGIGGKETDAFKAIADKANISAGGLMATAGVFFNF